MYQKNYAQIYLKEHNGESLVESILSLITLVLLMIVVGIGLVAVFGV